MIFFQEKFLIIPDENEIERLRNDAMERIAAWELDEKDEKKAIIRISVTGYTSNREAVADCLREVFSVYSFEKGEEADISSLYTTRDTQRNAIAQRVKELIEEMDWKFGGNEPDREKVIEAALSVVYGNR